MQACVAQPLSGQHWVRAFGQSIQGFFVEGFACAPSVLMGLLLFSLTVLKHASEINYIFKIVHSMIVFDRLDNKL